MASSNLKFKDVQSSLTESQLEKDSTHSIASFDLLSHDLDSHHALSPLTLCAKTARPDRYPLAHVLFKALFWLLSPKILVQPNYKPYQPAIRRLP